MSGMQIAPGARTGILSTRTRLFVSLMGKWGQDRLYQGFRRTLAASATRDGKSVICVVMSAPNWFQDAYRLMEYGFDVL